MAHVAIFTTPKPFIDPHISLIQKNAIMSWKSLVESVEIWLVGDEDGLTRVSQELEVGWIRNISCNSYGTPRVDAIFSAVREKSQAPYLCYVNADILLFPDLLSTLKLVIEQSHRFLLVGQRWDMNLKESLNTGEGWHDLFLADLGQKAKLHKPAGSDYFLFPRGQFQEIPPFAIGRAGWDNWMIFHARQKGMHVIDATGSITAIHQNHDFSHLPGGKVHRMQPESLENLRLAGGRERMFTLYDTNRVISDGRILKRKLTRDRILREIGNLPLLRIKSVLLARIFYTILNPRQAKKDKKKDQRMMDNIESTLKESK